MTLRMGKENALFRWDVGVKWERMENIAFPTRANCHELTSGKLDV